MERATGIEPAESVGIRFRVTAKQASALADLTVDEAAARLHLDRSVPVRHATFLRR